MSYVRFCTPVAVVTAIETPVVCVGPFGVTPTSLASLPEWPAASRLQRPQPAVASTGPDFASEPPSEVFFARPTSAEASPTAAFEPAFEHATDIVRRAQAGTHA